MTYQGHILSRWHLAGQEGRNQTGWHLDLRLSGLQNYVKTSSCSLSYPVHGVLLWQPKLTETVTEITESKMVTTAGAAAAATAAAKSLQTCLALCDPIDCSPPGSPVPGILQARTLQWVAISFSNAWKGKVKVKSLSRVWPSATPWTAAHQAPPSMGFSRQKYWSGVPLPSPTTRLTRRKIPKSEYNRIRHWKCVNNTKNIPEK